jgi:methylmalonyl-CoA/ethylmalonyl-CoA epimerase
MSVITKPFGFFSGFKDINQFAIVVSNMDDAIAKLKKTLEMGPWEIYFCKPPNHKDTYVRGKPVFYTHKFALTWLNALQPVEFEIVEPLEGPSVYKEFLQAGKDGMLHHVMRLYSSMDDVKRELTRFEKQGIKILQTGKWFNIPYYYLDTESKIGFIYEICYIPPDEPNHPPDEIK